jgi:hypothetical protein
VRIESPRDARTSVLYCVTLQVPGVIAAGVPGAGGYDALFAIIIEAEAMRPKQTGLQQTPANTYTSTSVRDAVETIWLHREEAATLAAGSSLTPLLLRNGPGKGERGAGVLLEPLTA